MKNEIAAHEILTDEMLRMKSLRGTEPVQAMCLREAEKRMCSGKV